MYYEPMSINMSTLLTSSDVYRHGLIIHEYRIFSSRHTKELIAREVSVCEEYIDLDICEIEILLRYFQWKEARLRENWLDSDKDLIKAEAGLPVLIPSHNPPVKCGICDISKLFYCDLSCGHFFCEQCWQDYIKALVFTDKALNGTCPDQSCGVKLPSSFIKQYANTKAVYNMYKEQKYRDFIQNQVLLN